MNKSSLSCPTCDESVMSSWCDTNCTRAVIVRTTAQAQREKRAAEEKANKKLKVLFNQSHKASKTPKARPVVCVETNHEYDSAAIIAKKLKVSEQAVYNSIRKGSECSKLHYRWKDEPAAEIKRQPNGRKPLKVMHIPTNKLYNDARDAAKECLVSVDKIRMHCLGNVKISEFVYVKED